MGSVATHDEIGFGLGRVNVSALLIASRLTKTPSIVGLLDCFCFPRQALGKQATFASVMAVALPPGAKKRPTPGGAGGWGYHARSMGELKEAFPDVWQRGLDLD
jgi:hypothetical protein